MAILPDKVMTFSRGTTHVEPHIKASNYIRDLVFGFGDGVNTSLGIVAGVSGAAIASDVVILAALLECSQVPRLWQFKIIWP